ncbi:hypothetical protein CDIK_1082 [Cucumispora dikerogammari]|nr:hypothetical protein CDIK_1082 [Cucumispora dikerogammari]
MKLTPRIVVSIVIILVIIIIICIAIYLKTKKPKEIKSIPIPSLENTLLGKFVDIEKKQKRRNNRALRLSKKLYDSPLIEEKVVFPQLSSNSFCLSKFLEQSIRDHVLKTFSKYKDFVIKSAMYYREIRNIQKPAFTALSNNTTEPVYLESINKKHPLLFSYLNIVKTNPQLKKFLSEITYIDDKNTLEKILNFDSSDINNVIITEKEASNFIRLCEINLYPDTMQHHFCGYYEAHFDNLDVEQVFKLFEVDIYDFSFDSRLLKNYPSFIISAYGEIDVEINIQGIFEGILRHSAKPSKTKLIMPIFLNAPPFLQIKIPRRKTVFQQKISLFSLEENVKATYSLTSFLCYESNEKERLLIPTLFFKHDEKWKWFDDGILKMETLDDYDFKTKPYFGVRILFYSRDN